MRFIMCERLMETQCAGIAVIEMPIEIPPLVVVWRVEEMNSIVFVLVTHGS